MKFLLHLLGELERNRMKKKAIKQGEVWMCNLPKGEDSEQCATMFSNEFGH